MNIFALLNFKGMVPPKVGPALSPPPSSTSRGKVSRGYSPWLQSSC